MPKTDYKITELHYKKIEPGFFEVVAITDTDKIAFEGNMCIGILKEMMQRVEAQGGKLIKVEGGREVYTTDKDIELKSLRRENKQQSSILNKIHKLSKT